MGDLLFYSVFFGLWFILIAISEKNKKPAVIRRHYDVVYNWFYNQYAQQYGNELPDFMNRQIISSAHAKSVELAQSGKLHKVYRQIKRQRLCV